MKIRKFRKNDLKAVLALVRSTFKKFNYKEGSGKAVLGYLSNLSFNRNKFQINRFIGNTYVAEQNNRIIGMIRVIWPDKIINLLKERCTKKELALRL